MVEQPLTCGGFGAVSSMLFHSKIRGLVSVYLSNPVVIRKADAAAKNLDSTIAQCASNVAVAGKLIEAKFTRNSGRSCSPYTPLLMKKMRAMLVPRCAVPIMRSFN